MMMPAGSMKSSMGSKLSRDLESRKLEEMEEATHWKKLRRGHVLWLSDQVGAHQALSAFQKGQGVGGRPSGWSMRLAR
jgi:hypothetical protein